MYTLMVKIEPANNIEMSEVLHNKQTLEELLLEVACYVTEGFVEVDSITPVSYVTENGVNLNVPPVLASDIAELLTIQEIEQINVTCCETYDKELAEALTDARISNYEYNKHN